MNADTRSLGIMRVGQIAVPVHDVGRATAFYRDVLGLPFLFSAGQLAFFDCGGVRLMLDKPEKAEFDHPSSILYLLFPIFRLRTGSFWMRVSRSWRNHASLRQWRIMICG